MATTTQEWDVLEWPDWAALSNYPFVRPIVAGSYTVPSGAIIDAAIMSTGSGGGLLSSIVVADGVVTLNMSSIGKQNTCYATWGPGEPPTDVLVMDSSSQLPVGRLVLGPSAGVIQTWNNGNYKTNAPFVPRTWLSDDVGGVQAFQTASGVFLTGAVTIAATSGVSWTGTPSGFKLDVVEDPLAPAASCNTVNASIPPIMQIKMVRPDGTSFLVYPNNGAITFLAANLYNVNTPALRVVTQGSQLSIFLAGGTS